MLRRTLCLILGVVPTLLFGAIETTPAPASTEIVQNQPVDIELVSEYEAVEAGKPFWVGVHLKMEDGWHTSWKNPGDAGLAPQIEWRLPEGFTVNEVRWPYPQKFEHDAIVAFGYEEHAMLLAKITPPNSLKEGDLVELGVDVMFVACSESCVPGNVSAFLSLKVGGGELTANPLFEEARARLPQSSDTVSAKLNGDQLILHMKERGEYTKAYFFPNEEGVAKQEVSLKGKSLHMEVDGASMGGVVVLMDGTERLAPLAVQIEDAVGHMAAAAPHAGFSAWELLLAIGGAFVGGLILNLMPCVLPVISLKILSFVNLAGSDRKKILQHGIMFTLGVLVSFWALASLLLILRSYGQAIGWGFQLQEPIFIVILTMVLFLLALSLLGVFEIGTSLMSVGQGKQRKGLVGSFFSGILATIVATPCTGPLLAPALGFAVTLPSFFALLVFTMMGLGMALPYLVLSAFPKLIQKLPKPGAWMVVFKQAMGFIMLATVVWLLWVFQAQMPLALVSVLVSLFILAVAAWVYGRWGNPMIKRNRRYVAYAFALMLAVIGVWFGTSITKAQESTQITHESSHDGWIAWDPQKFADLRAQGVPVFVDFTAKWCLICQTNKVPINSAEVRKRFKEQGVVLMEADWTRRDPVITEELAKFNRNGVPLYVLYTGSEEIILPQLLTKGALLDAADQVD